MTDFHFRPRGYKHFDRTVGLSFVDKTADPDFVADHIFSPLIHYVKSTKRYKPKKHKVELKPRPIMYASHRDACIFARYAAALNERLDEYYAARDLSGCVIAYRALGKGNYHFSAEAYQHAAQKAPCTIMAFDVSGFFDNLNHKRLKNRLKTLLGVSSLTPGWHNVFRAITRFRFVLLDDLQQHPVFGSRLLEKGAAPVGTVAEVKAAGVELRRNGQQFNPARSGEAGIPQGTPISAALSNVFMIEFDEKAKTFCDGMGAFYRRYSDDIIVICKPDDAAVAQAEIEKLMAAEELELSKDKTEITQFNIPTPGAPAARKFAQYLGFTFYHGAAGLRPSSMSRQWRKLRQALAHAEHAAHKGSGSLNTRKLRKRFSAIHDLSKDVPLRNFPSYARRSTAAFGQSPIIKRQFRHLERALQDGIKRIKGDLSRP
ncbi:MAG TPA: reverse transcriptase/maturase family protein [Devosiaceae bacterium]|jgi:hypothetical protein